MSATMALATSDSRRPLVTIGDFVRFLVVLLVQIASLSLWKAAADELGGVWPHLTFNVPVLVVVFALLFLGDGAVRKWKPDWLQASVVGWMMKSPSLASLAAQGLIVASVTIAPMAAGWYDDQTLSGGSISPPGPTWIVGGLYLLGVGAVARQMVFGLKWGWKRVAKKRRPHDHIPARS